MKRKIFASNLIDIFTGIRELMQSFSLSKFKITALFLTGVLIVYLIAIPVRAAEKIYISYDSLITILLLLPP